MMIITICMVNCTSDQKPLPPAMASFAGLSPKASPVTNTNTIPRNAKTSGSGNQRSLQFARASPSRTITPSFCVDIDLGPEGNILAIVLRMNDGDLSEHQIQKRTASGPSDYAFDTTTAGTAAKSNNSTPMIPIRVWLNSPNTTRDGAGRPTNLVG